ncbi:MAG: nucleotidyl transferase AbiEii/AbiGii toxin family protein [Acidobacteriota bacterium]
MNIFEEFPKLFSQFEKNKLKYALVGGVAMAFHDEPRFTKDIDILLFPEDIEKLKKILNKDGYLESTPPWTFKKINMTLHRFIKTADKEHM